MYIIILKNTEKNLDFFDKIKVSIFKIHFYSQKSGVKSKSGPMTAIEIEVKNIEELKEAIVLKPNLILLDNMNDNQLRECVNLCNGLVPLEASGNMTLERLDEIKDIGLDYISMGELTHSVKALDISMKLI